MSDWTEEEKQYVLDNHGKKSVNRMSIELGKNRGPINYMARKLGLTESRVYKEAAQINKIMVKQTRSIQLASSLKVGQKTKLGEIAEIYPHVVIVIQDGKRSCYSRLEVVGHMPVNQV
jgi:hypothetical protein